MKSVLFALLTSFCWGIAPFFEKEGLQKVEPFAVTTVRCLLLLFVSLCCLLWQGKGNSIFIIDGRSLFFVILGGVFSAVIGQITYFYALRYGQAWQVIPVVASYPLFTVLFSLLFLGEKLDFERLLGMALVIWGIFYLL